MKHPNQRNYLRPTDDYVTDDLPADRVGVKSDAVRAWKTQRTMSRPVHNGAADPVSITLVLDALLRLTPGSRVLAKELTLELKRLYPQYVWNAQVVGRILAGIAEAAKGTDAPKGDEPLTSYKSQGLNAYVVNANLLNWRWLAQVRHNMGVLAEGEIEQERNLNRPQTQSDFPWEPFISVVWGS